jgi:hypothetical protein
MSLDCCSSGSAVRHVLEQRRPQHAIDLRLADTEAAAHVSTTRPRLFWCVRALCAWTNRGCSARVLQPPSLPPSTLHGRHASRGSEKAESRDLHAPPLDCKSSVQPHHGTGAATHSSSPSRCRKRSQSQTAKRHLPLALDTRGRACMSQAWARST